MIPSINGKSLENILHYLPIYYCKFHPYFNFSKIRTSYNFPGPLFTFPLISSFPFLPMLAQFSQRTLPAFGIARGAGISAELHDAVAKIADFFLL